MIPNLTLSLRGIHHTDMDNVAYYISRYLQGFSSKKCQKHLGNFAKILHFLSNLELFAKYYLSSIFMQNNSSMKVNKNMSLMIIKARNRKSKKTAES